MNTQQSRWIQQCFECFNCRHSGCRGWARNHLSVRRQGKRTRLWGSLFWRPEQNLAGTSRISAAKGSATESCESGGNLRCQLIDGHFGLLTQFCQCWDTNLTALFSDLRGHFQLRVGACFLQEHFMWFSSRIWIRFSVLFCATAGVEGGPDWMSESESTFRFTSETRFEVAILKANARIDLFRRKRFDILSNFATDQLKSFSDDQEHMCQKSERWLAVSFKSALSFWQSAHSPHWQPGCIHHGAEIGVSPVTPSWRMFCHRSCTGIRDSRGAWGASSSECRCWIPCRKTRSGSWTASSGSACAASGGHCACTICHSRGTETFRLQTRVLASTGVSWRQSATVSTTPGATVVQCRQLELR